MEESKISLTADRELLRLTFSSIILASFFATLTSDQNVRRFLSPSGFTLTLAVLGISALFSFLYLLSIASSLKYRNPQRIDRFVLSKKVMAFFYDSSVNVFGISLIVWVTQYVTGHILHWHFSFSFIPLALVLFSITYLVMRAIWAGARRLIEYYYDISSLTPDEARQIQRTKRVAKRSE